MSKLDVLFVNPGNARAIYQDLATDFAAIEPPTWALLLAMNMTMTQFQRGRRIVLQRSGIPGVSLKREVSGEGAGKVRRSGCGEH